MSLLYSIILPVYNQRQNLPIITYLIHEISIKHSIDVELIIVEDNSPDGTNLIAQQMPHTFKDLKVKIISRKEKLGLGSAYRDGLKQSRGEFVILMDADLSHHPKYIPQMIEKQKQTNADIVSGSRYIPNGGVEGWNFYRKLTSRTANFLTKFCLSIEFSDFTVNAQQFISVLQELIGMTRTKGYSFQMEILVRAKRRELKIEQIPIVFVDRLYGKSKLGSGQIFLYLKGIGQLFFEE